MNYNLMDSVLDIENNVYPSFIKITLLDNCKNATNKERLLEITDKDKTVTVKTNGKVGLGQALQPQFISDAIVYDYEYLHCLNTITSNLKTALLGVYHGIAKKYLHFAIAEFEWRFNRRKFGKGKLIAGLRTLFSCNVMTSDMLFMLFKS